MRSPLRTRPRPPSRRAAALAASAALCATAALTAAYVLVPHDPARSYASTDTAGGPPAAGSRPTGGVSLAPLPSPRAGLKSPPEAPTSRSPHTGAPKAVPSGPSVAGRPGAGAAGPAARDRPGGAGTVPAASPPPGPLPSARPPDPPGETRTPPPEQTSAPEPALLTTDPTLRTPTDDRNCENVTLTFHNSGGTAVTSGQVTLGTHIIDSIGIDWATITSTRPLPAPIAPARGAAGPGWSASTPGGSLSACASRPGSSPSTGPEPPTGAEPGRGRVSGVGRGAT